MMALWMGTRAFPLFLALRPAPPLQVSISGQALVFVTRTASHSLLDPAGAFTYLAFFGAQARLRRGRLRVLQQNGACRRTGRVCMRPGPAACIGAPSIGSLKPIASIWLHPAAEPLATGGIIADRRLWVWRLRLAAGRGRPLQALRPEQRRDGGLPCARCILCKGKMQSLDPALHAATRAALAPCLGQLRAQQGPTLILPWPDLTSLALPHPHPHPKHTPTQPRFFSSGAVPSAGTEGVYTASVIGCAEWVVVAWVW
jgi:hypothetical protein